VAPSRLKEQGHGGRGPSFEPRGEWIKEDDDATMMQEELLESEEGIDDDDDPWNAGWFNFIGPVLPLVLGCDVLP